eukprot:COSAG04_NODE_12533_length_648_cov_0.754098_2_plen_63_part_01
MMIRLLVAAALVFPAADGAPVVAPAWGLAPAPAPPPPVDCDPSANPPEQCPGGKTCPKCGKPS